MGWAIRVGVGDELLERHDAIAKAESSGSPNRPRRARSLPGCKSGRTRSTSPCRVGPGHQRRRPSRSGRDTTGGGSAASRWRWGLRREDFFFPGHQRGFRQAFPRFADNQLSARPSQTDGMDLFQACPRLPRARRPRQQNLVAVVRPELPRRSEGFVRSLIEGNHGMFECSQSFLKSCRHCRVGSASPDLQPRRGDRS